MPDWIRVAELPGPDEGSGTTVSLDGVEVGLFRVDGELRAIEGRCPHQGASLSNGSIEGSCVVCPLHGWQFDLVTGQLNGRGTGRGISVFDVRADDGGIWLNRDSLARVAAVANSATANVDDGVHRYLIRYGSLGWIGLFGTVDRVECGHRDQVVVQTSRGRELGEVLSDPGVRPAATGETKPAGELLRVAEPAELASHRERARDVLPRLLQAVQSRLDAATLPLSIMDGELLFDAESAVLYFLGETHPDAGPLVTGIAREYGLQRIELESLIEKPPAGGGCGEPGCGGGGCHS